MSRLSHLNLKPIVLSTLVLLVLLTGCGNLESARVQAQKSQSTKTPPAGCSTAATPQNAATAKVAYTVSWEANAQDADNNTGISTLHVSALDVTSGKLLWQKQPTKISAMYQSSLQQLANGVLYIAALGSGQNTPILAVDTRDGHVIWQYAEKQGNVSEMDICSGKIYLLLGQTAVKVLRASDGKSLWSYSDSTAALSSQLIVTEKALYVAEQKMVSPTSVNWALVALGTDHGNVLWKKSYGDQQLPRLSLATNGQDIYVLKQTPIKPSTDLQTPIASIQALSGQSGKVLWTTKMPSNMEQINTSEIGNTLYLNGQDLVSQSQSLLVALNASTGKQLWQRQHSYDQISILNEQDIYAYKGYAMSDASNAKKQICSLDSTTGKERWCIDSIQPSLFSLSTTPQVTLVEETLQPNTMTLVQNIYAVNKQNGKILWKLPWKSSVASAQTLTLVTLVDQQSLKILMP